MDSNKLSSRKLAKVLGVSQPYLSQIRVGKRSVPEALKKKVEAIGAYQLLIGDKQCREILKPAKPHKNKRPPYRMAFLKLITCWRECEGVEPTYPARHEA